MRKLFWLSIICIFIIAGCGTTDEVESENTETEQITITHELGQTDVPKNPENIVVFDFGMLDTLDYLDIHITGVPQTNIPSYLEKYSSEDYENIGSLKEPDFEKISKIDPDLIIISGRQSEMYDELSKLGPVVYLGVDHTRYIDSFKENLEKIGKIFDVEDKIEDELNKIDDSISTLNEKAKKSNSNSLIILANDDKISAYGSGSRFGLIHDVFGIPAIDKNIEASTHGMNVSFEYVKEKDPDILYVIDRSAAIGEEPTAKNIVENSLMKDTKAFQNDKIIYLNADYWYLSGGGLVSMTKMIDEIDASID